ncbi:hemin uptake protein HemP [Aquabacter spiritensis]|uniref:Hemin uptake protein HemP n=1 Tax=Aquabacter spiritensis TaxID=933073 RepID=A0A4R3M3Q4_9HYPH|nr:hemin uptake protein HemP [Aquabacter spiritensis]TCT07894.1 hemin uptake protein HemP [Aquabacter spiritensis]
MAIVRLKAAPESPQAPNRRLSEACIDSADLFQGRRTVRIAHGDQIYTLTLTANEKLILTK